MPRVGVEPSLQTQVGLVLSPHGLRRGLGTGASVNQIISFILIQSGPSPGNLGSISAGAGRLAPVSALGLDPVKQPAQPALARPVAAEEALDQSEVSIVAS